MAFSKPWFLAPSGQNKTMTAVNAQGNASTSRGACYVCKEPLDRVLTTLIELSR